MGLVFTEGERKSGLLSVSHTYFGTVVEIVAIFPRKVKWGNIKYRYRLKTIGDFASLFGFLRLYVAQMLSIINEHLLMLIIGFCFNVH